MPAGAPIGNENAKRRRVWADAIRRALARHAEGQGVEAGLDKLADRLVDAAASGDPWALKEIGDRLDGKPTQVIAGDEDAPVMIRGAIELVRPAE